MSSKTIGESKKHTNTSKKGEKTEKQTRIVHTENNFKTGI